MACILRKLAFSTVFVIYYYYNLLYIFFFTESTAHSILKLVPADMATAVPDYTINQHSAR